MPKQKTHEEFVQDIFNLVGNEYEVLSEYVNRRSKIKMKHNVCGTEYEVVADKFYSGRRCKVCAIKARAKTHEQFVEEVFNLVGDEYEVLTKYTTNKNIIKMKHNSCGTIYEIVAGKFIDGNRCFKCSYKKRSSTIPKSNDEFLKEIELLVGNEYTFLEQYKGNKIPIKVKHNSCNNIYAVKPNQFTSKGRRCPFCNESKGEKAIDTWLHKNKIKHTHQKTFKSCSYKQLLRFDFLVKFNNTLVLIEYDGIQHFEPIEIFGGEENFKTIKKRDSLKNKWCNKKNIELLRISYKDYERIPDILQETMVKFND